MFFLRQTFGFVTLKPSNLIRFSRQLVFKRNISCNDINPRSRAQFRMSPNVFRQQKSYTAVVKNIYNASPSIKVLTLHVKEPGFSFKAGQWVDFYIPGIEEVTGYSMTSPPYEARHYGTLDLAIKEGSFPPTHWVHTKCSKGEEVTIRVGGDFYYDPKVSKLEATADLLLIGGGVGINPLVSILLEYCYLIEKFDKGLSELRPGNVHLLYSARTEKELIFKEIFLNMAKSHPTIRCQFFVTGEDISKENIKCRRIEKSDLKNSIQILQKNHTLCFICGPLMMTDEIASLLSSLGIQDSYIRYEKWW